jgi:hypothetical protein
MDSSLNAVNTSITGAFKSKMEVINHPKLVNDAPFVLHPL